MTSIELHKLKMIYDFATAEEEVVLESHVMCGLETNDDDDCLEEFSQWMGLFLVLLRVRTVPWHESTTTRNEPQPSTMMMMLMMIL